MALTVWAAFDAFRRDSVDLPSSTTSTARSSRDYLFEQLKSLDTKDPAFPDMSWSSYLSFGSFARKTKIRPLDDIDLMILLNGRGTESHSSGYGYTYRLRITDNSAPLSGFNDGYGNVNSRRVLNQIKSSLSSITNYRKADIKRSQQAVVLNLASYDWAFDIVPALPVSDFTGSGIAYYLIPDGGGNWIRTDPRKDSERVTATNKRHSGNFLPVMRLLKFWNRRTHKPRLASYYFETLVQNVFAYCTPIQAYPTALQYFFQNCQTHLMSSCADPKGLGPPLDEGVDWQTKTKIRDAMNNAAQRASFANMYEQQGDHKNAIYWWREIFGSEFPTYG
ncbi:hypothetical protein FYK55_27265 [Roseiconus nitratireducens]|uniref:Nucleotidyltransferase n=2 Tax=Roseiconus nitratireducens TaxID=2605748 RepID=A0A5M6CZ70_9BACT|nr:hypothetical protein FYK55_27265 [Roseiconus nitratireducens]